MKKTGSLTIYGDKKGGKKLRNIEAVIFDMDNTLFDLVEAKVAACRRVTEFIGTNEGKELLKYFLKDENRLEDPGCIAEYMKDRQIYDESLFQECCEIYKDVKLKNIKTYDGVEETLQFLDGKLKMGIVTNAFRRGLTSRLKKTGLLGYFDITFSREDVGSVKPDPEPLLLALNELGVEPKSALKVGDSLSRDIKPAIDLGMVTAYAKYGDRNNVGRDLMDAEDPDIKLEPHLVLDSIRELSEFL